MYRVTVDGVELEVEFQHRWTRPVSNPPPKQTGCLIFLSADRRLLGFGTANCSTSDQFCRATGRKLALTRAVADLPKHVRKAIWEGYWRATRGVCELS